MCQLGKVSTDVPTAPPMPYTKSMINQDQMQSILSDYAKQYSAMMARSAAAKAEVAGATEILTPESDFPSWGASMGQWQRWNISDRD